MPFLVVVTGPPHEPLDLPGETIRIDTAAPVDLDALGDRIAPLTA